MSYFLVIEANIPRASSLLCLCITAFCTGSTRSSCLMDSFQGLVLYPLASVP